jgi:hypothetical protein
MQDDINARNSLYETNITLEYCPQFKANNDLSKAKMLCFL